MSNHNNAVQDQFQRQDKANELQAIHNYFLKNTATATDPLKFPTPSQLKLFK